MKVRVTKKLPADVIDVPIHTEFINLNDVLNF